MGSCKTTCDIIRDKKIMIRFFGLFQSSKVFEYFKEVIGLHFHVNLQLNFLLNDFYLYCNY